MDVGDTTIAFEVGGSGPSLLLLHGYPQTHLIWHAIAPRLAERFTVVCPDLRGYGASGKPASDAGHAAYSKRVMANDMGALMTALGHERFAVAAHDRGARVAHRLAMDHPARVERLCLMDIVPNSTFYDQVNRFTAAAYWHWFFLIQPSPIPERLIGNDSDLMVHAALKAGWRLGEPGPPEIIEAYTAAFRNPETIRAACEDYRAGASIDCKHEADDRAAGRKLSCPLLLLFSRNGLVGLAFDPVKVWSEWANDLECHGLDCGHFLPEEMPGEVTAQLLSFLGQGSAAGV